MFNEILTKQYYGNTVKEWILAFIIIFAVIVIGKILYWISTNILKKFASKTSTKLDYIFIDMVEEPVILGLTLAGVWYALNSLNMNTSAQQWMKNIYQFIIAMNVAWLISRLFDAVYEEYLVPLTEKTETDLDDQLLPIVKKGTRMIIWAIAVIVALNNAGYDVGALIAGLGIGGLAFAMAAKDTISNVFGGFTIFTDQPFKLNDRVKVAGHDGFIREIGLRSTRVQTLEGRLVTIPNSKFADTAVENVSAEPNRKVVLNIGLTYDTTAAKMQKAMDLLKKINEGNDHTEENALVSFNAFNESAMNILFIYYISKGEDILQTMTEMNMEILKQFNRAKLDFAFPSQTIYTKKG